MENDGLKKKKLTITNALNQSLSSNASLPLFRFHHRISNTVASLSLNDSRRKNEDEHSTNGSNSDKSIIVNRNYIMSYGEAWCIASQHRTWIEQSINNIVQNNPCELPSKSSSESLSMPTAKEIVIAYLSWNTPDYLLSLIGCFEFTQRFDDTIRAIPVLLNARWTSDEIARSLRIHTTNQKDSASNDTNCRRKNTHYTILLYGHEFEMVATQVVHKLQTQQKKYHYFHHAKKLIIPNLCLTRIAMKHQLLSIKPSLNKSSHHSNQNYTFQSMQQQQQQQQQQIQDSSKNVNQNSSSNHNKHKYDTHHDDHDDVIVIFTSGTSSKHGPKGARLGHASLLSQAWTKTKYPCSYNSQTCMMATTVPLFHIGGLSSTLAILLTGGTLVFPYHHTTNNQLHGGGGGFNPSDIISSMGPMMPSSINWTYNNGTRNYTWNENENHVWKKEHTNDNLSVNILVVVPAMLHSIISYIQQPSETTVSIGKIFPHVKLILVGGQSITQPQFQQSIQIFPNAKIVQTYACTEAGSSITFATLRDPATLYERDNVRKHSLVTYNPNMKEMKNHYLDTNHNHSLHHQIIQSSNDTEASYVGTPPSHIELKLFPHNSNNNLNNIPAINRHETTDSIMSKNNNKSSTSSSPQLHQIGIIATRGPHVMNGYWQRTDNIHLPQNSKNALGLDNFGWLVTNDLGYILKDDANGLTRLYYCGRANDAIRTGGETVHAHEVEGVIVQHPHVDSCAIFALPDDRLGETVCAAIVPLEKRDGGKETAFDSGVNRSPWKLIPFHDLKSNSVDIIHLNPILLKQLLNDLRLFCKHHNLSGYKSPRKLFIVTKLPTNSSGKVLKYELKRLFNRKFVDSNRVGLKSKL